MSISGIHLIDFSDEVEAPNLVVRFLQHLTVLQQAAAGDTKIEAFLCLRSVVRGIQVHGLDLA